MAAAAGASGRGRPPPQRGLAAGMNVTGSVLPERSQLALWIS
jgi:hypothetical protein